MEYKVGDRVKIKSLDWYNENKDGDGNIRYKHGTAYPIFFTKYMSRFCGETVTIKCVHKESYYMNETGSCEFWTDEMIEGLAERNGKTYPYKIGDRVVLKGKNRCATITDLKYNSWGNLSYYIKIDNDKDISIDYPTELLLPYDNMIGGGLMEEETKPKYEDEVNGEYYSTPKYLIRPSGYQFVDENGNVINAQKIVLEKKKKGYPKTYEECAEIITELTGSDCNPKGCMGYMSVKLTTLQKLLICRNAYWKIAGEEMGLGKPWKPSDSDYITGRYCIFVHRGNILCDTPAQDCILTFPTEEMRDAFKENFDPDIESCKELL